MDTLPDPRIPLPVTSLATLMLLGDSRFPAGGHAHSGGVESAHHHGWLASTEELEEFIDGRLRTSAFTDAVFAAAASRRGCDWLLLDHELGARTLSPRLRTISRSLGRQLLRVGARAWPTIDVDALSAVHVDGPMQPIALGAVAGGAGLGPREAALCSLHHAVGTYTTAAVRLLGLDPFDVQALAARLAARLDALAADAVRLAHLGASELPATTGLLTDILAEDHATWEVRLFAS